MIVLFHLECQYLYISNSVLAERLFIFTP
uniref:Uncharacterized protein n=1 Tax=Anguilla anguilla TaxID=7936 RepID=A0A0E9XPH5_ANGAN